MEFSEYLATVEAMHSDGKRRGLFFQTCEDAPLQGRTIALHGKQLLSFSSCSYLGLEQHPRLIEGVHAAVDRYGTQFSSSRGYLSAPLYDELEDLLSTIFDGYAMVASSTSLGHQSTLMTLATENDVIVLDHQVHHSVHLAANLARAGGAKIKMLRHGHLEEGYDLLATLAKEHETVWFAFDGVFSMFGDLAPIGIVQEFLDIAPNIRLYVDDAHGMSWTGKYGRGSFLSRMPMSERMVVATSLNKAFAAAGGCIIFPNPEEREKVKMCGGPQLFSGPVQPPMLGAALASAQLHLSDELPPLQQKLRDRVRFTNQWIEDHNLPLLVKNEAPIIFVPLGAPKVACTVAQRMIDDGFFVNVSMYPAVPMKRSGIRLAMTSLHTLDEVEGMLESLAHHAFAVMEEEQLSAVTIDEVFRTAVPSEARESETYHTPAGVLTFEESSSPEMSANGASLQKPKNGATQQKPTNGTGQAHEAHGEGFSSGAAEIRQAFTDAAPQTSIDLIGWKSPQDGEFSVSHYTSIFGVGRSLWNRTLGSVGACSWDAMAGWEKIFKNQPEPENNWDFHYIIVRGAKGKPVAVTFFTRALIKDDMLMRDAVSTAVEKQRGEKDDPYYLTSNCLMMGSLCSEGNHLYLDREGPWQEALLKVLEVASLEYERSNSSMLMLRDLPANDPEMDQFLQDNGFIKVPMLDSHYLDLKWPNEESWLASLSRKKRYYVMRSMRDPAANFSRHIYGCNAAKGQVLSDQEHEHLYTLYRDVAAQKLRINVFPLPPHVLKVLEHNPAWEIVTFKLAPALGGPVDQMPVACYAAHIHEGHYMPLFCGLDYRYVREYGAYRQMLYQMKQRAEELNMKCIHYGLDADFVKSRLGTRISQECVYVQSRDDFHGALLGQVVAELGMTEDE